jgi:hypothetical protein
MPRSRRNASIKGSGARTKYKIFAAALMAWRVMAQKPMSVCDLFVDLPSHSGKPVVVHGALYRSRHGIVLVGQGCNSSFVTKGYRWPTSVAIRYDSTKDAALSSSIEKLDTLWKKSNSSAGFSVTLEGLMHLGPTQN